MNGVQRDSNGIENGNNASEDMAGFNKIKMSENEEQEENPILWQTMVKVVLSTALTLETVVLKEI